MSMPGSVFFFHVMLIWWPMITFFFLPGFFCNVLHSFISLVDVSSVLFLEALMKCLTLSSSALQFFL